MHEPNKENEIIYTMLVRVIDTSSPCKDACHGIGTCRFSLLELPPVPSHCTMSGFRLKLQNNNQCNIVRGNG